MKLTETEIMDLYMGDSTHLTNAASKMAGIWVDSTHIDDPTSALDSTNNGGSTDYYKLDPAWTDLQDIIEAHSLNFAQGNILKAAFAFNIGRHSAATYERDLNKIIWFAQRELEQLHS